MQLVHPKEKMEPKTFQKLPDAGYYVLTKKGIQFH